MRKLKQRQMKSLVQGGTARKWQGSLAPESLYLVPLGAKWGWGGVHGKHSYSVLGTRRKHSIAQDFNSPS